MATFGFGTSGGSQLAKIKPPAAPPKIGFGTSGGTELAKIKPPSGFLATGPTGIGKGLTNSVLPKASPQQAAGAATPAAPGTPDYDSGYYIDLAGATQKANNTIAGLNADITNAGTTLGQNQANLARSLALQTMNAQNVENARGGFGLGALGQNIGNINAANQAQALALTTKYGQDVAGWNAAIAAAQGGLSTETIALQLASRGRQSKLVGASGGTLGTAAPAAAPGARPTSTPATRPAAFPKNAKIGKGIPKAKANQIGYRGGF